MPTITINGKKAEFTPGQMILQVANTIGVAIPQYCYHDGLSIVASCRICLGECWAPNPKTGKLEPYMGGKLLPTCQTPCVDGMVVYTDSPKAVQNQKAVMEYLLINHPLDCPVCDQAGECFLQDYSYEFGRGVSRFEEAKVKQPKKDIGPHVLLYSDRCIMCSRCVRFTREVSGTSELSVQGRGNRNEIDIFPGRPLDNELSANVIDLCPVGALLDKDFLFAQRVWFLKSTPSIDPLTASGDNIWIEHNEGKIYRIKPRTNPAINKWWITDEVRYGWKFVHSEDRLRSAMRRQYGTLIDSEFARAYAEAVEGLRGAVESGKRLAVVVSPMLTCEEAWLLGSLAKALDQNAVLAVGPVPVRGQDKTFPPNAAPEKAYRVYAEKAPNARGVRRALEKLGPVLAYDAFLKQLKQGHGREELGGLILTGNYSSADWAGEDLPALLSRATAGSPARFVVLIDTLRSRLVQEADVILPGATWAEKAGTFENARGMLQAFDAAISPLEGCREEARIALELLHAASPTAAASTAPATYTAGVRGSRSTGSLAGITGQPRSGGQGDESEGGPISDDLIQTLQVPVNAAAIRARMAAAGLPMFGSQVLLPKAEVAAEKGMEVVEL